MTDSLSSRYIGTHGSNEFKARESRASTDDEAEADQLHKEYLRSIKKVSRVSEKQRGVRISPTSAN